MIATVIEILTQIETKTRIDLRNTVVAIALHVGKGKENDDMNNVARVCALKVISR